ncbi:Xaa-Pro dipeptidyl-peptidase [Lentilactobacillus sp. Marseille-Q4993]|uniref:Xaa-Pro dipeptidyl-peptidase n=1 Tax=Lentilactobacillus sp. Marseille-Q4993 TaxID=3039492 RepID=UPI0024BCE3D3|nr:Xaa-Pro dipeptidyl-peptidase [Lentilactobacillus sp. Marseille-Q4993]
MKINQFAYVPTDHAQIINELKDVRFLTPKTEKMSDPVMLFRQFLMKFFMEKQGHSTRIYKLSTIMATPDEDANEYTKTEPKVEKNAFYNIALQLLQFEVGLDFNLDEPLKKMNELGLPVADVADTLTVGELIDAWYLLLNTRTKFGQTLIDYLAGQGFFAQMGTDESLKAPLFFNGKSQAVFNTQKVIREVVYVEAPQDNDNDGKLDLIKVEVLRPAETDEGVVVPAVLTESPYDQGTNDDSADKLTHDVNGELKRKEPNNFTYDDIKFVPEHKPLPAPRKIESTTETAEETFTKTWTYPLNDYLLSHGFAVVYSSGVGTKDSDGFRTTGDEDETISTTAVIEWLNHKRTAFTNRTDNVAIEAWWSNGNVGMTGRSYLGTLANAAALSGVEGLKTAVVEAGISNWYDYYRENGLVVAPGGFQGEDADILAELTFSRKQEATDYVKTKDEWAKRLKEIEAGEDRDTGNYNRFWDRRNYLNHDNIKADILLVHGLNDWNVKPSHAFNLRNLIKNDDITLKTVLHQGQHEYLHNFRSVDFTDMVNLWLVNKLYGVDNGANTVLPDVLVQDNVTEQTWTPEKDWGDNHNVKQYQLDDNWLTNVNGNTEFSNHMNDDDFKVFSKDTAQWRSELYKLDESKTDGSAIKLISQEMSADTTIDGQIKVSLNAKSDHDFGALSVAVVDYGTAKRLTPTPTILDRMRIFTGFNWRKDDLREFTYQDKETEFKKITDGHINMQNRENSYKVDDLKANESYQIEFALEPTFFRIAKGHKLGILIFSSDLDFTVKSNQDIKYAIDLSKSSIDLPLL